MPKAIELLQVSKRYGGVNALSGANFSASEGRIHALLGENGAGKSTLIKIMAGVVRPDEGQILLDGVERSFVHPQEAVSAGVACIFQELSLMPDLSVEDNICITSPPRRWGLIDRAAQRKIAVAALERAGASDIHPGDLVSSLSLSRRQMVEIAKALSRQPKILILDEATSALTAADVNKVFELLKRLRSEGMAIIYISHRMNEIAELADDCSVFRNGQHIATFFAGSKTGAEAVELMIGRDVKHVFPPKPDRQSNPVGNCVLQVQNLGWENRLSGIDLKLHRGEIVGLGGLDGQGQKELLLAMFGVLRGMTGRIDVCGNPMNAQSPRGAKQPEFGIALVPEDRKTDGLLLPMSVLDNLTLGALDSLCHMGVIVPELERTASAAMVHSLSIKAPDLSLPVGTLSGGNQQKVVIGKWLANKPQCILLNDPTRGIDIGTKQEIYALLRKLADEGASILLYSTDYAELIGCCDRVAVFFDGRISRWLQADELTEHALVSSALNIGDVN